MKKLAVLAVLLLLPLASMSPLVGCGGGKAEKGEATGEKSAEEETFREEVAKKEAPSGEAREAGPPTPGGEESAGTELPSGYLYQRQEIGSTTPFEYLQLVDVRWADHGDHFRVVAELKRLDGTDATFVPWCFAEYSDDPTIEPGTEIHLYIRGVRREDIHVTSLTLGEGALTGDAVCYQLLMTPFGSVDGVDPVNIFVSTRDRRPFRLTQETAPLRIILDIWK